MKIDGNPLKSSVLLRFFDFLKLPDGSMDLESAVLPYIDESFASSEQLEAEIARVAVEVYNKDVYRLDI